MARAGTAQGLSNGNPDIPHEGAGHRLGGHDRVEHAGDETPERAYHSKNDACRPDRQVYKGDRRHQTFRKEQESRVGRPDHPVGRHRLAGTDRRAPDQIRPRSPQGRRRGVTIAIDLTYLGSVLKAAKNLWRLPVDPSVTAAARDNMRYLGMSPKSNERDRRPKDAKLLAAAVRPLRPHQAAEGSHAGPD